MEKDLQKYFENSKIEKISFSEDFSSSHQGTVYLILDNRVSVSFNYWRLQNQEFKLSGFDHNQNYGGENPIDTRKEIISKLASQVINKFVITTNKDIQMKLNNSYSLEVFSFTPYEDWIISLPNGAEEYSNRQ